MIGAMDVIWRNLPFLMLGQFPDGPLGGLALTLYLTLTIGAASFCIGIVFATMTLVPVRPLQILTRAISIAVRGVPALAFLFWTYFLIPRLLDINLSPLQSASLALVFYHGAYMGEDIRGGIQNVAKGQWEAAQASGLRLTALLCHVILPQAVRAATPALVNRFVNLFMYTSVVSVLGILEFTRAGILVNNREIVHSLSIFGFLGFVYFLFAYLLSRLGAYLERRWSWARRIEGRTKTA